MELIATRTLAFRGRRVVAYEQFTVDDRFGRVLLASGKAIEPEAKAPPRAKVDSKPKAEKATPKKSAAPKPKDPEDLFEGDEDEDDQDDQDDSPAPADETES